ncbi:MAG: hypothetical protein ABL920_10455 [Methylotenera sp.]
MLVVLRLFWDICLLHRPPQDIPYSQSLLNVLLLMYAMVAFLALSPSDNAVKTMLEVTVEMSLIVIFVWGILAITRHLPRFKQTLCAFLGTDALISVLALPALAIGSEQAGEGAMIAMLVLMLWHWVVVGHIVHHALSQSLWVGLSVAFLYCLGFFQLMNWLFPMASA